ncbi:hypothetical protein Lepto7375DRAFT_1939 [Leptolyngbya sp. PCC 7375]|nr:hypothetical protein Lepto7375DRAFT_1939 [Leptolyngbya sp. PCC 7375]
MSPKGWFIVASSIVVCFLAPSAWPQQATTVTNTANGNFGDPFTPDGPLTETESNEVPLSAVLGEAILELIKTGDRAAAEPGDTVIYRLLTRHLAR